MPYIILSVTNQTSEPSGSSAYNTVIAFNPQLAADPNYCDIRAT